MSNKQSSVVWFAQESWKLRVELEGGKISLGEYANKYYQLKEKAKAMHKEEIIKAWVGGKGCFNGEQYYNQTFGGEQ